MLIPKVVGFKLNGKLPTGTTATDLVLTITQMLRKHGVVGKFVEFYGMSSDTAMIKHHGEVAEYRSSEGRTVRIPFKGAVSETVRDLLGGIRSTCTYVGAPTLKQLAKCTTFIKVSKQFNDVFVSSKH